MVPQCRHPRVAAAMRRRRQRVALPLAVQRQLQGVGCGGVAAERHQTPRAQAFQLGTRHGGGNPHLTWG